VSVRVGLDGAVGTLTLDAPPLNLLGDPMRHAMLEAIGEFRARGVRAIVITGSGRAFCAGADLRDEAKLTPDDVQAFLDADEAVFTALAEFPGATIAAVNGYAYGGGFELALACDLRLTARSARLAGVGVTIGLTVSTARLARIAGEAVALDLLLTGRAVAADEALTLGLVSAVVDDGELSEWARLQRTRDHREALEAFFAKRPPVFTGE